MRFRFTTFIKDVLVVDILDSYYQFRTNILVYGCASSSRRSVDMFFVIFMSSYRNPRVADSRGIYQVNPSLHFQHSPHLSFPSIRNRLTALKKNRAEYVKPSDVNSLYQAVLKQGESCFEKRTSRLTDFSSYETERCTRRQYDI
jgi:hypothetical protein